MLPTALQLHDYQPDTRLVCTHILEKLALPAKELPDALLYSEEGSQYFEAVTQTPGYYLARAEIAIMEMANQAIAQCVGGDALLVEYGSGSSRKTRLLLDALPNLAGYVPIDISKAFLLTAAQQIANDYPTLEVLPVCADYEQAFTVPSPAKPLRRRVAYFPGSTIGNRPQEQALAFLQKIRRDMGDQGGLLIGVDLKKDPQLFANAYNENEPVINALIMSALKHLNQAYGADFDLNQYRFKFVYNAEKGRVEICLLSLRDQTPHVCGQAIPLAAGELILLQVACKYTLPEFAKLAGQAGWQVRQVWTDPQDYFSVQSLESMESAASNRHA
jgi:dimethylhistidine N-methyltransferase